MASRIGVHLELLNGGRVFALLQESRSKLHCALVRLAQIIDPYVKVDLLLLGAIRPLRCDVIECELDPQPPFAVHNHAVPVLINVHLAAEQSRPKCAFRFNVCRVEGRNDPLRLHVYHRGRACPQWDGHRTLLPRVSAVAQ